MALAHDRYLVTGCSDNELRFFALRSTSNTDDNDALMFPPLTDEMMDGEQVISTIIIFATSSSISDLGSYSCSTSRFSGSTK